MGLPLAVYPGTYTPGAETALHAAVDVINETWAQGNAKLTAFEDKIGALTDEGTGWLSTTTAPQVGAADTIAAPVVVEPNVTIPTEISTANILADYEAEYMKIRALMVGDLTKIFTDYFPEDSATYNAAETWIQAAIANPSGGLPATVAAQLLTDETDKITLEAARATDSVVSGFAARGFPLPPGMAASAAVAIQQTAQDQKAVAGRKLTAISIDMMKFAIEKALNMRQLAMNSTLDYIKTLASAPDVSSRVVGIGYDAQSKLISSVSGFLSARTEVQKLVASVAEFNVTTAQAVKEKNQIADMTLIEDRLKALLAECQVFGQMATSLFNNLHASSGTGYSVSA